MSEFDDEINEGLEDAISFAGETFTFQGQELHGVFSQADLGTNPETSGFSQTANASVSTQTQPILAVAGTTDVLDLVGMVLTRDADSQRFRITQVARVSNGTVDLSLEAEYARA